MITIKLEGLKEALDAFDSSVVKKAARAAIDRSVQSGRTVASEEIQSVWNVKKPDLDPRIKITPPRMDNLTGIISISGKGMSLSYFGARQIMGNRVISRNGKQLKSGKVTRGMLKAGPLPQGVMVQVMKGRETALLRNAFMSKVVAGKGKGSHIGVFRRSGNKRLPIYEKNVISIATMANRPEVMAKITQRIQERWLTEFPRQLQYYRSRGGK